MFRLAPLGWVPQECCEASKFKDDEAMDAGPLKIRSVKSLFAVAEKAKVLFYQKQDWYPPIIWFRGQSRSSWSPIPKVYRPLGGNLSCFYTHAAEANMTQMFNLQAFSRRAQCPQDLGHWLCLMQHYGLPTRLLDWTESILVAAFFAVENARAERLTSSGRRGEPAAIWAISPRALNYFMIHEAAMPRLECVGVMQQIITPAFGAKTRFDGVIATMPPEIDARMTMQQSRFTIHGTSPSARGRAIEELEGFPRFIAKFEIPHKAKAIIEEELCNVGIRRATLFPDLQNLSHDLAAEYGLRSIAAKTHSTAGDAREGKGPGLSASQSSS